MKKLILIVLSIISFNCYSSNWKQIPYGWVVDTTSIQKLSNGNIKVWFKHILPTEVTSKIQSDLRNIGIDKNYSNYSYSLSLFEINCSQRTQRSNSGIDYTFDNRVIDSYELPNGKFSSVIPDSEGDFNFKYICSKK